MAESTVETAMLETKKCLMKFCVCSVWLQIHRQK